MDNKVTQFHEKKNTLQEQINITHSRIDITNAQQIDIIYSIMEMEDRIKDLSRQSKTQTQTIIGICLMLALIVVLSFLESL